jgi:hypothetical protein
VDVIWQAVVWWRACTSSSKLVETMAALFFTWRERERERVKGEVRQAEGGVGTVSLLQADASDVVALHARVGEPCDDRSLASVGH